MKSLLLTILAAGLAVPTLAAPTFAAERHQNARAHQAQHRKGDWHQFKRGEKFDRSRAKNYREINYRTEKRLKAPPRGYRWVRSGNDALLVQSNNGLISSVVGGLYR